MFKKSILVLAMLHFGANAAEIQFVTGSVINPQQAEQLLETKLLRKHRFSHHRKGQYGNYYSFMPIYKALPVFNLVDSVAASQQGQAFRLYVSNFSAVNKEEQPISAIPSDAKIAQLLEKQQGSFTLGEIELGWWAEQQGLKAVWNVTLTETLQSQVVTQHYFINTEANKVIAQRGEIPVYQSEVNPLNSGRNKQAWIFDPDPKTSLMSDNLQQQYTPHSELAGAAFRLVELKDLTLIDHQLALIGPYAQVIDFSEPYDAVETLPVAGIAQSQHSSASFLQQMAYYHVDSAQRHLQSLGFEDDKLIHYAPITIDAQGSYNDQSAYSFYQKRILLGTGGHADAQDADVIWHEYGHSVTHFINPFDDGADSGAIGEGYADFFAASHSYRDPQGYDFEPDIIFNWDARFGQRRPRTLNDIAARYNPNYFYPAHIHVAGSLGDQLWSTPLFQSFKEAEAINGNRGMDDIERVVIEAMYGLGAGVTMPRLALSTLDMAKRMYPEEPYAGILQRHFSHHNLLPKVLVIEQAEAIDAVTEDISVVVNIRNISPYSLRSISLDANSDALTSIETKQIATLATGESTLQTLVVDTNDTAELTCGSRISVPISAKYTTGIPVLNQSQHTLEVTLGQPEKFAVIGEGNVLKDAVGEPDGIVHSKGITNFYLDLGEQSIVITEDLKLDLRLQHNDLSQLSIKLISPAGHTVSIWDQHYYPHTQFAFSLPSEVAKVDFSPLYGQSLSGQWQLQVIDHKSDFGAQDITAKLNSWQLSQITGYQCQSSSGNKDADGEQAGDSGNKIVKKNDNTGGSLFWLNIGLILIGLRRPNTHIRSKYDI